MKKLSLMMTCLVSLLLLNGCMKWQEPVMIEGKPFQLEKGDSIEQFKYASNVRAQTGWSDFSRYNKYGDLYYLKSAADCFNSCWRWDPNNYNAYWGWGVIRGIQATLPEFESSVKLFLDQSVDFLLLAEKYNVPPDELNNLRLDQANAYNGLGSFYQANDDQEKAEAALRQGHELLAEIVKSDSENGRAYFLLSVNSYYLHDLKMAHEYADKAHELNYEIPEDYMEALQQD